MRASFDFANDTATLTDIVSHRSTFPLQQVLLQANGGNAQAAAEMRNQMSQAISAAKADAIMAYAGPSGTSANSRLPTANPGFGGSSFVFPPPRGAIGFDDFGSTL